MKNSVLFSAVPSINNAVLQGIRVASAFFGKGQFIVDDYTIEEEAIHREQIGGPLLPTFSQGKNHGERRLGEYA